MLQVFLVKNHISRYKQTLIYGHTPRIKTQMGCGWPVGCLLWAVAVTIALVADLADMNSMELLLCLSLSWWLMV